MPLRFDPGVAEQILTYARLLTARGYVHNQLGNVAIRVPHPEHEHGVVYTKHAGVSLEEATADNVVITDVPTGALLYGTLPTSVGHQLNREILRLRPDVGAVIHVHLDEMIALFASRAHRGRVPGPRRRRFHVPKFAGSAVRLPRSPGAADVTRTRVGGHVGAPHVRQVETFTTRTAPECPDFGPFRAISARLSRMERCDLCSRLRYAFVLMRPATRTWIAVVIVGCVLAGGAYALTRPGKGQGGKTSGGASAAPGPRATPVVIALARAGDLPVALTALGSVTALNTVTVRSRVDGQLLKTLFSEGQLVRQGELLAEIDPSPFQAQLTQAEGQLARDMAALQNARLDLERYRVLVDKEMIARQQFDTQAATVRQAEGAVKADQGQLELIKVQLSYTRITAPLSGRVGLRLVDPGNMVKANDPGGLVVITQIEPIALVFAIPEDSLQPVLRQYRSGKSVAVDAYDREGKRKLASGTLAAVDNQIDPGTGTVKLKAAFANRDGALFPNH